MQPHPIQELYVEHLTQAVQDRSWYRELNFERPISKISFNITPTLIKPYLTRNINNVLYFKVKYSFFEKVFFPSVIMEWNELGPQIQNTPSLHISVRIF